MSFGSSFVQTLTPTLREILGQAIQTREAKKRYEEYFRQQGELTDRQQANAMAQIAERERVAQDKAKRDLDFTTVRAPFDACLLYTSDAADE